MPEIDTWMDMFAALAAFMIFMATLFIGVIAIAAGLREVLRPTPKDPDRNHHQGDQ